MGFFNTYSYEEELKKRLEDISKREEELKEHRDDTERRLKEYYEHERKIEFERAVKNATKTIKPSLWIPEKGIPKIAIIYVPAEDKLTLKEVFTEQFPNTVYFGNIKEAEKILKNYEKEIRRYWFDQI